MPRPLPRTAVTCALAAAALAWLAAPANADIHPFPNFNGTCALGGTATFASPLRLAPAAGSFSFAGDNASTCTGALAWGHVPMGNRTWRVAVAAANSGTLSCAGSVLPNGRAKLTFLEDDGTPVVYVDPLGGSHPLEITVVLDTVAAGSEVALGVRGRTVGRYPQGTRGRGTASFAADQATVEACAGAGVSSLDFTATVVTGPSIRSNRTVDGVLVSLLGT